MRRTFFLCFLLCLKTAFAQSNHPDSLPGGKTEGMYAEAAYRLAEKERSQTILYVGIALGIVAVIRLYLLFGPGITRQTKLVDFFSLITLLLLFLALYLWLHPAFENITHLLPVSILAWVAVAALLAQLHYRTEKWTSRKLLQKNKRLRLAAAKKSMEGLEKRTGLDGG